MMCQNIVNPETSSLFFKQTDTHVIYPTFRARGYQHLGLHMQGPQHLHLSLVAHKYDSLQQRVHGTLAIVHCTKCIVLKPQHGTLMRRIIPNWFPTLQLYTGSGCHNLR